MTTMTMEREKIELRLRIAIMNRAPLKADKMLSTLTNKEIEMLKSEKGE